jgi:hypothetical protein
MRVVATAPMPGIMTPSFPVTGLMLAAACVAAPGVDMLGGTLLWCDIPCNADSLVSLSEEEGCKWRGMLRACFRTSIRWTHALHKFQQRNNGDVDRSDFTGSRSHSGMGHD